MPWFPVKKIRKQIKLLLLLVLLTCAAWLTYVHLGLVRQGRRAAPAAGLRARYGRGARQGGGGEGPKRPRARALPLRSGLGPAQSCLEIRAALPSSFGSIGAGGSVPLDPAGTPDDVNRDVRDPLERPHTRVDSGVWPRGG